MPRHVDHALSESTIGTKDVYQFHEEMLANEWHWGWTRPNGQRVSLRYDSTTGSMSLGVHRPNDGYRHAKYAPLAEGFSSPDLARKFAMQVLRKDTMPHGEAAHAGRLGRIG